MPKGTPYGLKCRRCRRGMWREPRQIKGCRPTGRTETRITRSGHCGHGSGGGESFEGHRGEVECLDCGHRWFSTNPRSGRQRARRETPPPPTCQGTKTTPNVKTP